MNQYYLIRRLRGPAILLLFGILALLNTMGVVHHLWRLFWPLLFILLGLLLLAERAALAAEGGYPVWPFSGYGAGGNIEAVALHSIQPQNQAAEERQRRQVGQGVVGQ